jgi:hypothetical protein
MIAINSIDIAFEDRMFVYLYEETDKKNKCKFGEHFVKAGHNPKSSVEGRVYGQGSKIDSDNIVLVQYWDVAEFAKSIGKNTKGGHVDDAIRNGIGIKCLPGKNREAHGVAAIEYACLVNEFLIKQGQPLPEVQLTQWQYDQVENVLAAIEAGHRTFLMELCARFGKTLWAGALVLETERPLTIIVSYVQTSFASFKKDLSSFQQFKDVVIINSKDNDYEVQVVKTLADNKQIIVFVSMCKSSKRDTRLNFLFSLDVTRLIIADEPDFGLHRAGQATPLIEGRSIDDVVILMTGTNADRAASSWDVDYYACVTYPELIIQKRETEKQLSKSTN